MAVPDAFGEPPVHGAARKTVEVGLIAEERDGETILHEGFGDVGDHLGWGVVEKFEDAHQPGTDVVCA